MSTWATTALPWFQITGTIFTAGRRHRSGVLKTSKTVRWPVSPLVSGTVGDSELTDGS